MFELEEVPALTRGNVPSEQTPDVIYDSVRRILADVPDLEVLGLDGKPTFLRASFHRAKEALYPARERDARFLVEVPVNRRLIELEGESE